MKPQPDLLRRYLLRPNQPELPEAAVSLPLEWSKLFGRRAPLAVELGFGAGDSLNWWAGRRPEWNFVGIEQPLECILKASSRLQQAGRENVRLIRGDARYLLPELFPPISLHRILMQFPMPWPKERHAKHRVSGIAFAESLAHVLAPDGRFELVTDQDWFAFESQKGLRHCHDLAVGEVEINPERPFRTRYERKWLAEGRSIFRLTATLRTHRRRPSLFQETPMLHQKISTMPSDAAIQALAGRRFKQEEQVAEIKEVFQNPKSYLLRVLTADQSFSQLFFVRLEARQDGSGLLKIEDHPRPYLTSAVRLLLQETAKACEP
ncbi:MAG: hypothetical protein DWQ01_21755 [Planctomycetota bacterium]|nr:MAG: hypothetical protein DWQ01_21755 [Planctomycetota bacterium]